MRKYLIFRTDRVGDFLFTLKLIKIIKTNDPCSEITVIGSQKNYKYIQTFSVVDKIILLKNDLLSKIKLIFYLRKITYDSIIVHDGKNRSKFISFFLKFRKRVVCVTNLVDTQIDIIKKACQKIHLEFDEECIDFLEKRNHSLVKLPYKNYIHLHFDEKWKYSEYIKKYTNIEPNEKEFLMFINKILIKGKKLIITTGKNHSVLLNNIKKLLPLNRQLTINIFEVEQVDLNATLLADLVVEQLEKRVAFRRAIREALQRAQKQNVNGIKIQVSGRLNGAEIARSEWIREGRVPLQTLRADIDYATREAQTNYGVLGIKVWLFKNEILTK